MPLDLLGHLRSDSTRFLDVLAEVDPARQVPTCGDWTVADLLWHLTEVQDFWGTIVDRRLRDPGAYVEPTRPQRPAELPERFRAAHDRLSSSLAWTPDDAEVWTWDDRDHTVGFVRRRQAHEALIHRLDAELSVDARTDLDPDLATDGVLEVLDVMYGGAPSWAVEIDLEGPSGRIATTDTGASWNVRLGTWSGTSPASGIVYQFEPFVTLVEGPDAEATQHDLDFEITGRAADLDAWCWNRPTRDPIAHAGDTSAIAQLLAGGVQ